MSEDQSNPYVRNANVGAGPCEGDQSASTAPSRSSHLPFNALSRVLAAAERCEGGTVGRLCLNTSAACDAIASAVSSVHDSSVLAKNEVRAKAFQLCALRDKRLEWQSEEFDASKALLEGWERQLSCLGGDRGWYEDSMQAAERLLNEVCYFPTQSIAVFARDCPIVTVSEIVRMSYVQVGVDPVRCVVSHPPRFKRGEWNQISIACSDSCGEAVWNVRAEDVELCEAVSGWSVSAATVEGATVRVSVSPQAGKAAALALLIDTAYLQVPLQVRVVAG